MNDVVAVPGNPLSRAAFAAPPWLVGVLSAGGRATGAALALFLGLDQSYDRTQVFTAVLALVAIASLAPVRPPWSLLVAAAAAGMLFFAGSSLWDQPAGVGLAIAGAAAGAGAIAGTVRRQHFTFLAALAFLGSLGLVIALVVLIALTVEG